MNSTIGKILNGLIVVIFALAGYFFVQVLMKGHEAIVNEQGAGIVGPFVYYATALFLVTAGITLLFSLLGLFKKPEALKKTLLSLVLFGIVIAICYNVADDGAVRDVLGQVIEGGEQGTNSKLVSTGIWITLILGAVAIASIVFGGVKSALK